MNTIDFADNHPKGIKEGNNLRGIRQNAFDEREGLDQQPTSAPTITQLSSLNEVCDNKFNNTEYLEGALLIRIDGYRVFSHEEMKNMSDAFFKVYNEIVTARECMPPFQRLMVQNKIEDPALMQRVARTDSDIPEPSLRDLGRSALSFKPEPKVYTDILFRVLIECEGCPIREPVFNTEPWSEELHRSFRMFGMPFPGPDRQLQTDEDVPLEYQVAESLSTGFLEEVVRTFSETQESMSVVSSVAVDYADFDEDNPSSGGGGGGEAVGTPATGGVIVATETPSPTTFAPTTPPSLSTPPTGASVQRKLDLADSPKLIDFTNTADPDRWEELKRNNLTVVHHSEPMHNASFTIDILSVGSRTRLDYMFGQIDSWGAHGSVRDFWGLSELDDFNYTCDQMTEDEVDWLVDSCTAHVGLDYDIEQFVNHMYTLTEGYIHRFDAGWLCAQRRVSRGLGKLTQHFDPVNRPEELPSYLMVVDDDTYFDIDHYIDFLKRENLYNVTGPQMITGCVIEANEVLPYSFPYGGFGLAINKETLRRLYYPIQCETEYDHEPDDIIKAHIANACNRIQENRIGEQALYEEGMSVMQLFHRYAGIRTFCFHSDWLTGYIANFYKLSEIHGNVTIGGVKKFPEACGNMTPAGDIRWCADDEGICHNQGPKQQDYYIKMAYEKNPGNFRNYPELSPESIPKKKKKVARNLDDDPKMFQAPSVLLLTGTEKDLTSDMLEWFYGKFAACRPNGFDTEPDYLNNETIVEEFANRYLHCNKSAMTLDALPNSFPHAETVHNLYKAAGGGQKEKVNIVLVVTEPLRRELETYNTRVNQYLFNRHDNASAIAISHGVAEEDGRVISFEEYVDRVSMPKIYQGLSSSLYEYHLKEWLKYFPRKQILVVNDIELQTKPWKIQWRLRSMFHAKAPGQMAQYHGARSPYQVKKAPCEVKRMFDDIFDPLNEELYALLDSDDSPRPGVEQSPPFHRFQPLNCSKEGEYARLPNLLMIGAPKAGMLDYGNWLFPNEEVCGPRVFKGEPEYYEKEVHFFDDEPRYNKGVHFYAKRYEHCDANSIMLDSTPTTMEFPERVRIAYDAAGGDQAQMVKIIFTVREPVSRELAYYNQLLQEFNRTRNMTEWYAIVADEEGEKLSFSDFVDNITIPALKDHIWSRGSPSRTGLFARDLQQWAKLFSREQMLVLDYEELQRDPKRVQQRIRDFVGKDLPGPLHNYEDYDNRVEYPTCEVQNRLQQIYADENEALVKLLEKHPGPPSEARPFPVFTTGNCIDPEATVLPTVHLVGASTFEIANWLLKNGACRPQVFENEPDYYRQGVQFFNERTRFERGLEFYSQHYSQCGRSRFVLDSTQYTILAPERLEAVYEEAGGERLKELKLIVVLDEPVTREINMYNEKIKEFLKYGNHTAWYGDIVRKDGSIMSFDEYTQVITDGIQYKDSWGIADMGMYSNHIKNWLQFIDRDQILAVMYDELKRDPEKVQQDIRDFLDFDFPASAISFERPGEEIVFKPNTTQPSCFAQQKLNAFFEPMREELQMVLGPNAGTLLAKNESFPVFTDPECIEEPEEDFGTVLPNVLMIGAQKAGTTAIAEWLFENGVCRPQVFDGEMEHYRKEVQFFDQKDRYEGGVEFYSSRYQHCGRTKFKMDATPNYLPFPERVETIFSEAGQEYIDALKVIVVLREPVSRELSLYNHKVFEYLNEPDLNQWYSDIANEDGSVMPFDDFSTIVMDGLTYSNPWGLADMGLYSQHLRKWGSFLSRTQILAITYDELKHHPESVQNRVREFLGFNFPGEITVANANDGGKTKKEKYPSCYAQARLNSIFEPMNHDMYHFLNDIPGPEAEEHPYPPFIQSKCTGPKPKPEEIPPPRILPPMPSYITASRKVEEIPASDDTSKVEEVSASDDTSKAEEEPASDAISMAEEEPALEILSNTTMLLEEEPSSEILPNITMPEEVKVLPNILMVGAQKAGTTSIAKWLFNNGVCHPMAFEGEPKHYNKEVQFFDQKGRYEQGVDFYSKRFEHCANRNHNFMMDATPNTLPFPERVEKIYNEAGGDQLKSLKIMVMLREPVGRELSLYNHKIYEYSKTHNRTAWYSDVANEDGSLMTFDDFTDVILDGITYSDKWGLASMGLYARHLKKWMKIVDRSQILLVTYNEIKEYPESAQRRVREFLGADFPGKLKVANTKQGKFKVTAATCFAQEKLNDVFEPMNQELYKLLEENPGPRAEEHPFPKFSEKKCVPSYDSFNITGEATDGEKVQTLPPLQVDLQEGQYEEFKAIVYKESLT